MTSVIVTIHGILQKDGNPDRWQYKFDKWLKSNNVDVVHELFCYGWLGPINSWRAKLLDWVTDKFKLPRITRRVRINEFKQFLLKVKERHPGAHIHILAHSFGTFITREALVELVKEQDFTVTTVTLVGGIISSYLDTNELGTLITNKSIFHFFNWSSYNDDVVLLVAVWPFGKIGYYGVLRPKVLEDTLYPPDRPYPRVINNHTTYSHSEYFDHNDFFSAVIDQQAYAEHLYAKDQANKNT